MRKMIVTRRITVKENKKKIHIARKDFYTIPNILCYFRFALVPLFITFYLYGLYHSSLGFEIAGIVMVVLASLTDLVDGKIARKFNLITDLGKFLDPAADKVMQFAIAIVNCLVFKDFTGHNYMWVLLGVFITKELTQFLSIYLIWRHGQYINGAKWYGKLSTFVFDVLMIVTIAIPLFSEPTQGITIALNIMLLVVLVVLIFAWVMYIVECVKLWKSGVNNIPPSIYGEESKEEDDND